jgi:hypothetical protein
MALCRFVTGDVLIGSGRTCAAIVFVFSVLNHMTPPFCLFDVW